MLGMFISTEFTAGILLKINLEMSNIVCYQIKYNIVIDGKKGAGEEERERRRRRRGKRKRQRGEGEGEGEEGRRRRRRGGEEAYG